jgi:hypothetical protein
MIGQETLFTGVECSIGKCCSFGFGRLRNLRRNVKGGEIARAVRPYRFSTVHKEDLLRVPPATGEGRSLNHHQ